MKQIYHNINKWECVKAGFFNTDIGINYEDAIKMYASFLSDLDKFESALKRVITEWEYSCDQFLSNENMNRIAWLGQSSMCISTGIPSIYRAGFKLLSVEDMILADTLAFRYLNIWIMSKGEKTLRRRIMEYIKQWEQKDYINDIPDEVPSRVSELNLAPSYKQIAMAVLKNDHSLKTLGLSPKKSEFYSILKKMELDERNNVQPSIDKQIYLF